MTTNSTSAAEMAAQAAETTPPDRRRFLMAGAVLGAGAALARHGLAADGERGLAAGRTRLAWPASPGARPSNADWAALRQQLSTHKLSRPGESSYPLARRLYDPRFDSLRPAGVAYCGKPADVGACLSFAGKFHLPVRARSGGHSYGGWSSVTDGLVIDVTRINHFFVGNGNVSIGSGLDMINLYSQLAARGLAIPGGSCPTVGIAGLALGGGVGVLSRQYGLTSDSIESVQIVTADGKVLNCDSSHHGDLYWACRGGGGGNFGVATSFTMRTHKLRELVVFSLTWPWARASRVVNAWQSWAPHGPDALWSNLHLSTYFGQAPQVGVGGTYLGSVSELNRLLRSLYNRVGSSPASAFVSEESFLNAMLLEANCSHLSVPQCNTRPGGQLPRQPSYAKSDFFSNRLSTSGIRTLLAGIERASGIHGAASRGVAAIAFDACGAAINRVRPDATAFVHRDALFLAQYSTSWNNPGSRSGVARQHEWLRAYYADLHPHANGQAYQNYVDPDLTNWRQAYYGANYARLSKVKAKYDPGALFNFPQAITA